MTFFDPALADALQPLALLVETAGFTLVVLDIYAPGTARRLEGLIHRTSSILTDWKERRRAGAEETVGGGLGLVSLLSGLWLILLPVQLAVLFVVWLLLWPVRLSLEGLDHLAGGHALAGLGLVLAAAGLCLELHQLLSLCWTGACPWPFG